MRLPSFLVSSLYCSSGSNLSCLVAFLDFRLLFVCAPSLTRKRAPCLFLLSFASSLRLCSIDGGRLEFFNICCTLDLNCYALPSSHYFDLRLNAIYAYDAHFYGPWLPLSNLQSACSSCFHKSAMHFNRFHLGLPSFRFDYVYFSIRTLFLNRFASPWIILESCLMSLTFSNFLHKSVVALIGSLLLWFKASRSFLLGFRHDSSHKDKTKVYTNCIRFNLRFLYWSIQDFRVQYICLSSM